MGKLKEGLFVVDVSEHQEKIDWNKVKPVIDGAILRLGYGSDIRSQDDKYWNYNVSECERLGIPYGAYLYSYANGQDKAKSEAAHALRLLKGHHPVFPVYIDIEERRYFGTAKIVGQIFCDTMKKNGFIPGIYTPVSVWNNNFTNTSYENWIPTYGTNNGAMQMKYRPKVSNMHAWQYSSKARINGINGDVDVSVFYKNYLKSSNPTPNVLQKVEAKQYSRDVVVAKINSWIGKKESNGSHKSIIDIYNRYGATHGYPRGYKVKYTDSWCATTVSAVFIDCGYADLAPIECGCPSYIKLAKKMGIWKEDDNYAAQPGDIILYDWQDNGKGDNVSEADHIGIITAVNGSMFTVVEGNKSDSVSRRSIARNAKFIRGFVAPKYTTSKIVNGKMDEDLAVEVMLGKHGKGDARKTSLGFRYDAVQKIVNEYAYHHDQFLNAFAEYILKGYAGNGEARKSFINNELLYGEVQAVINRKLRG